MCLATAYVNGEKNEPILQDIAHMQIDGEYVQLKTLLGQEKVIRGRVIRVDFSTSKLIVERYDSV